MRNCFRILATTSKDTASRKFENFDLLTNHPPQEKPEAASKSSASQMYSIGGFGM